MPVHRMTAGDGRRIDVRQGRGAAIGRRGQDRRDSEYSPRALAPGSLSTSGWRCVAFRDLWCEIRCHLLTDVNERIRWFPDVNLSGMSGFGGHLRTVVESGVGSSLLPNRSAPETATRDAALQVAIP